MGNIKFYEQNKQSLKDLIKSASSSQGAKLVIPDLQRPYVWSPAQVVLLVDSLIKGWPFGTLLLWSVSSEDLPWIPFRTFWNLVDRTASENSVQLPKALPPASFRMVLDGQQRVQSLLLAFGGDDWAFKLKDREWAQSLEWDNLPSGSHWTKGSLSLCIPRYVQAYNEFKNVVWINFREVLEWTVDDPAGGISNGKRPPNYRQPLVNSGDHPGEYLRLSRLWAIARSEWGIPADEIRNDLVKLLDECGIGEERQAAMVGPLLALVGTFVDLKQTEVGYLRLIEYDSEIFHEQAHYNDSIVSIFTRLNTAGRTLTRQEITFAWIKSNWNSDKTDGQTGLKCFEALLEYLRGEADLRIDMDGLVKGVSSVWSALFADGSLLTDKDLLRADTLRPMATDLSDHWKELCRAVETVTEIVAERELESPRHYRSLNSLFVLWGWASVAQRWLQEHKLPELQRDSFEKSNVSSVRNHAERWLLLSQWAGKWASSTDTEFAACVKDISVLWSRVSAMADPQSVAHELDMRLAAWVDQSRPGALTHIDELGATDRKLVRQYFAPLWIWHRLDKARWKASSIPLRAGKKAPKLEVDHVVAYEYWRLKYGIEELDDSQELVANSIGNCLLLEKSFNISKGMQTLGEFLQLTHEFKDDAAALGRWIPDIALSEELVYPAEVPLEQLIKQVAGREQEIKGQLLAYVRGEIDRVDAGLDGGPPPKPKPRTEPSSDEGASALAEFRRGYWTALGAYLRSVGSEFDLTAAPAKPAVTLVKLTPGIALKAYCSQKGSPGLYLRIKGENAEDIGAILEGARVDIERTMGVPLEWQGIKPNGAIHVVVEYSPDGPEIADEFSRAAEFKWLHETAKRFVAAVRPLISPA